ncbi:MAG: DnaD domain protein [Lachnospiraceae bacterium]|nr:DnaD domain protein [Lachnospiraceae bacterium]
MEKFVLERSPLADITLISNLFLDEYMPKANGEYVKVYLYILRCSTKSDANLSVSAIADVLERTEADVTRALKYWEQVGILGLETDNMGKLSRIIIKDLRNNLPITFKLVPEVTSSATLSASTAAPFKVEKISSTPAIATSSTISATPVMMTADADIPQKREFTNSELKKLTADEDIKDLLYIAQTYLGKTLSPAETNTILYFYDGLGFPVDLIEYLIEYCISGGHKSLRYIEKVATNWAKENIDSVDAAKAKVAAFSNNCYPVLQAFGLQGRNPATSERAFIVKWTDEYGFSMDMILNACNRTIDTIHQPSFQYADSILQRWLKNGVKTPADIKTLDAIHDTKAKETISSKLPNKNNSFSNFSGQRDYDYAALERDLLRRR